MTTAEFFQTKARAAKATRIALHLLATGARPTRSAVAAAATQLGVALSGETVTMAIGIAEALDVEAAP